MAPPSPRSDNNSAIMRKDLEQTLKSRSIDPLMLSSLQRILLTTDGTVTEMLAAFSGESIKVVKLYQKALLTDHPITELDLPSGEHVLQRRILLQGRMSQVNFIYADSVIALDHLPDPLQQGLLESGKGIGQLFLENRVESFREILDCGTEPVGELARYFSVEEDDSLLYRTYTIVCNGRPVILITEKFPERYFRDWELTAMMPTIRTLR